MTGLALGIAFVLVALAAAVRAGGASLVRSSRADALRDAAGGDARAGRVAALLEDRLHLQPALGAVHSTLLVAAAVPATWALTAIFSGFALLGALVVLAVGMALAADLLPRSWGRARPRRPAYALSRLLQWAIAVGHRANDLVQDVDEEEPEPEDHLHPAEEMGLISSVLEFADAVVREVMVPRPDMFVIAASADTDEALELVMAEGRSRIPVTGEGIDDIVGILYAKDLLRLMHSEGPKRVGDLMRTAYYVPETKRVSELLREMQANKVHMAVVIDEFGGVAGLVTIEDIIEELVGEIVDEYDEEEQMVVALDGGGYLVDGRLPVDDFGELLGVDLPDDDWDTVGGLILSLAGRVPLQGESFEFGSHVLVAERVQGRRVARVRIGAR
jgi:CBS domain containing-hemolysin-like protein